MQHFRQPQVINHHIAAQLLLALMATGPDCNASPWPSAGNDGSQQDEFGGAFNSLSMAMMPSTVDSELNSWFFADNNDLHYDVFSSVSNSLPTMASGAVDPDPVLCISARSDDSQHEELGGGFNLLPLATVPHTGVL